MERLHNEKLLNNAKQLRKNQTKEERKLWFCFLNTLPVKFTRQKVLGNYIADFCCSEKQLIIELDGSQHYEDEGVKKDEVRNAYFKELGFSVLHYSNLEINRKFRTVCDDILQHLGLE